MKKWPDKHLNTNQLASPQDLLRKLSDAISHLELRQALHPSNLTIGERLERYATDSIFHWLKRKILEIRATHLPEKAHDSENVQKAYVRSDIEFIFGRAIPTKADNVCTTLAALGQSRRDIRFAVFSRMINDDGAIEINWLKEKLLYGCGLSLLIITAAGMTDLLIRAAHSPTTLPNVLIAIIVIVGYLATPIYVLLIHCLRGAPIAKRLREIQAHNLL